MATRQQGDIIHTGGEYGYHAEVVDEADGRSYPMGGCPEADSHPEHNGELCMGYDEREAARYDAAARKPKTVNHDERMDVRVPVELKGWAMANGGSELVRRLLEAERKRQSD